MDDGAELSDGIADAVDGVDGAEQLAEFGDGVLRGDFGGGGGGGGGGGCGGLVGGGGGGGGVEAFGGVEESVDV